MEQEDLNGFTKLAPEVQLENQIAIIKKFAKDLDENQSLVAQAMTQVIMMGIANGEAQNLMILDTKLNELLTRTEKPVIHIP